MRNGFLILGGMHLWDLGQLSNNDFLREWCQVFIVYIFVKLGSFLLYEFLAVRDLCSLF